MNIAVANIFLNKIKLYRIKIVLHVIKRVIQKSYQKITFDLSILT